MGALRERLHRQNLHHAQGHDLLFGTDSGPRLDMYRTYYRFLETDDEYFDYDPSGVPTQGRWCIHGLDLGQDVLEKIYYRNAAKLFSI